MRLLNRLRFSFALAISFLAASPSWAVDDGAMRINCPGGRGVLTQVSSEIAVLTSSGSASFFVGEEIHVSVSMALRRDAEPISWPQAWPELVRWTVDEVTYVEESYRSAGWERWPSDWRGKLPATVTLKGEYGTSWTQMGPGARVRAGYSLGQMKPGHYVVSAFLDVPNREEHLIAPPALVAIYRGDENPKVEALALTEKAGKLPRTGAWFPQYRDLMLRAAKLNPTLTDIVRDLADTSVGNTTVEESALFYERVVETVKRNIDANTKERPELKQRGAEAIAQQERERERFLQSASFAEAGRGRYKLAAQRDHGLDLRISVIEVRSGRSVRSF